MISRTRIADVSPRHRLLAAVVIVLWGLNFLAMKAGLEVFDPFFFAALRFGVLALPVLLFVPRPEVAWRWLLLCSAGWGVGQFGFMFAAMHAGLQPGLMALVAQSSVPFTVILGTLFLGERLTRFQTGALALALTGMGIVVLTESSGPIGLVPLALGLSAGACWAVGNIATRRAAAPLPLRLTLWMCLLSTPPLLLLSALFEGPSTGWRDLAHAVTTHEGTLALLGLAYVSLFGTVVGSGLYMALMSWYPASTVAPLSLLVPVVSIAASALVYGERVSVATLAGGALVILGAVGTQRRRTPALAPAAPPALLAPTADPRTGTPPTPPSMELTPAN